MPDFLEFLSAKAERDALDAEVLRAAKALDAIPGVGSLLSGLTPDAVKFSPEYRRARATYDQALSELRAFNGVFTKTFRKDLQLERLERRNPPADGVASSLRPRVRQ